MNPSVQRSRANHLVLLSASHGMNHVYQLLFFIILPEITVEFGISNLTAGLLAACFILPYSLLPILAGYLATPLNRKRLMSLGFILSALSFLALGFVNNIVLFGLLLFTAGIGGSTYHPSGVTIISEIFEKDRGKNMGFHQTGGALGSVIAPIFAGILVLSLNWRSTLMLLAIPGIVLAVALWFFVDPAKAINNESKVPTKRGHPFKKGVIVPAAILIAAALIYTLGLRGTDGFANQYFTIGRGINFFEASILFALLKVAGLFGAPICGKLSDKFERKKVLMILVVIGAISLFSLTVLPNMLLAIPCIILGFANFGLLTVGEALLADLTPKEKRSAYFGANFTLSFSSSIVLLPVLGAIADTYSFELGFIMLSMLMPFSLPLLQQIKTKKKSEPPPLSH
ncbi:MFS transporter [Candidatus Bathyarchaeota archaeon]|nr:MFS transporter [Candidatus Bathyarchaeota archaeon]